MDKKQVLEALKKAREAKERKFSQSIDLIVNLRGLDLKKAEHQVDFFTNLQFPTKKARICALVAPEMKAAAQQACDTVVVQDDFPLYAKDKKMVKRLTKQHDFFIAQANLMAQIATAFGKVLGPKGKMPNPKAGCVFPPNASLRSVVEKLQHTIRISAKTTPVIHCLVGKEDMSDEEVATNITSIYDQIIHHLPSEEQNIKSVFIKLTMGKPVRLK